MESYKTVYERNLDVKHTIGIGSFVEINEKSYGDVGCHFYVAKHVRDKNGYPLNLLTKNLEDIEKNELNKVELTVGYKDSELEVISH